MTRSGVGGLDWRIADFAGILADPEIPAIARALALRESPMVVDPVAQFES
jgi:hypothetical protein